MALFGFEFKKADSGVGASVYNTPAVKTLAMARKKEIR